MRRPKDDDEKKTARVDGRPPAARIRGDYWDRAAKFLDSIRETPRSQLTTCLRQLHARQERQRDWLQALKQDLWEPGD